MTWLLFKSFWGQLLLFIFLIIENFATVFAVAVAFAPVQKKLIIRRLLANLMFLDSALKNQLFPEYKSWQTFPWFAI